MKAQEFINGTPDVVEELQRMLDVIESHISLYRKGKVNILTTVNFINAVVVQTNEKLQKQ